MSIQNSLPAVMVVDDNADDVFVLRQRLQRSGVGNPIVSFSDGEEAMAHLKRAMADPSVRLPCVILLDVRMPRCGGFEVLRWVRAQSALKDTQVVIVSTSTIAEDATRAKRLGATHFLSKFPSPETLAQIINPPPAGRRK